MATQTSFYVIVLSMSLASIFFFKVNSTEITSFSIPKFVSNPENIIFQGDTYASNGKLTLTTAVKNVVGRALYYAPIHIWDNETRNVADFTTSFTFVIDAPRDFNLADGLAFFIASVDTKPQSGGEYLGVFNRVNSPTLATVAVEFDTYYNREWDPSTGEKHIGINVNSIRSKSYKGWSLRNHARTNVMINFDVYTNVLNANLTYPNIISYTLSDVMPLKDVVPVWVRIGLSATTGAEYAAHEILLWSFYSKLGGTSSSNQVAAA